MADSHITNQKITMFFIPKAEAESVIISIHLIKNQSHLINQMSSATDVIGSSNHMCGDKSVFSDLDESFRGMVKFGDNSKVSVMGKDLKSNLLSMGQLQEKGYGIVIKAGTCISSLKQERVEFKIQIRALVEKEVRRAIKTLRTDRGGEYTSREFANFYEMHGIKRQLTIAYTPQQNGVSERKNRTILNMVRSMLTRRNVPNNFWLEAVNWTYAHIPDEKRKKLDDKGEKCIFLSVSEHSKAYKLYNPITKKIVISRDVVFDEERTWTWAVSTSGQPIPVNFDVKNEENCDPVTFQDAIKDPKWQKAMDEEITSIERNNTWELTNLPKRQKSIGVKWIYKTKLNGEGKLTSTKFAKLQKDISKNLASTTKRFLL
ncbi:uncharacterized protein LOC132269916 [Cornus florida]|uniref:uncharacterized protein LOC132269916 n=1 Tax=Cornus florida TaxID=4283 RepID=UPI0028A0509C|nr:uncharacterized protein LOC132269916 [Cornus florida]